MRVRPVGVLHDDGGAARRGAAHATKERATWRAAPTSRRQSATLDWRAALPVPGGQALEGSTQGAELVELGAIELSWREAQAARPETRESPRSGSPSLDGRVKPGGEV